MSVMKLDTTALTFVGREKFSNTIIVGKNHPIVIYFHGHQVEVPEEVVGDNSCNDEILPASYA